MLIVMSHKATKEQLDAVGRGELADDVAGALDRFAAAGGMDRARRCQRGDERAGYR